MIDRSTWARVMAGIVSAGILGAVLWPVFAPADISGHVPPNSRCLSNVKQVTLSLLMYESDYEALPHQDWTEASYPYTKNRLLYRCPEVKEGGGYAMNAYLLGKRLPKDPKVALVFETSDLTMGATSEVLHPLSPPRHDDRQVVGFVDGSVKIRSDEQPGEEKMNPAPGKTR